MYAHHDTPGDAGDFGDLYARYHARLVRYCGRRLGREEAEDAAHEVLLRALQAWSRFDGSTDAWPWLATIASRVCADVRRRSARPAVDPGRQAAPDVHEQAVARVRATILEDALGRLPPRYRNPLVLKEYGGWTYRDIAELEGRSVSSVRSRIMRSRRHLGDRVESVARSQGQWPLPAVVPGVAERVGVRTRRGHVMRTWLERAAQTAAAVFDSSFLVGALTSPSAHAVIPHAALVAAAAAVAVLGTAGPVSSTPRPTTPAAAVSVQTTPGGPATIAARLDSPSSNANALRDMQTVARLDDHVPDNAVIGVGPVEAGVEYQHDRMTVTVNDFFAIPMWGDTHDPTLINVACY